MLVVHYHRPLLDYDGWDLWVWCLTGDLRPRPVPPAGRDDFGLLFHVDPEECGEGGLGILPRQGDWLRKDVPERAWHPDEGSEIWIVNGRPGWTSLRPDTHPFIVSAFIESLDTAVVRLSTPLATVELVTGLFTIEVDAGGAVSSLPVEAVTPGKGPEARTPDGGVLEVTMTFGRPLDHEGGELRSRLTIQVTGYVPGPLLPRHVLDGPEFESDLPMGARPGPDATTFRVFAPTATALTLNLHDVPVGGVPERHAMIRAGRGLWEIRLPRDLTGVHYTLCASGHDPRFDPGRELIDPYSRCNTAHDGRGLIVSDATPVADPPPLRIEDAVIAELHIRDFTIAADSGVRHKGLYAGVGESGTALPGTPSVSTGLDHLVEMGFNVVQILPIHDFENDETSESYDWGYMPVHFNSPDGWYASSVHGAARIVEAKRMVDALHRRGLRVVMDVVYNHTAERPPRKIWSFEGLVPGYYYRLRGDGTFSDGSGTGNEFRSESPMGRKFILDSLRYWVREYRVDGFRFDLMGLIDLDTLSRAVAELRALDPDLLIYGEPWTGGATPIEPTAKGMQRGRGFGVFNDHFRDAVKGPRHGSRGGFVQEGVDAGRVRRGLEGSIRDFALEPVETINYVECHDNQTLWDRIEATTRDRTDLAQADRVRMHLMATAMVLLAQGLPFLQAGQEMLRTKGGHENSYNQPDSVNAIFWSRKKDFASVVAWVRALIAIRRAHSMFRMGTADLVRRHLQWLDDDLGLPLPSGVLGFRLLRHEPADAWEAAVVLFNPAGHTEWAPLPPGDWRVFVDGETASAVEPVREGVVAGYFEMAPRSVVVLGRAAEAGARDGTT